MHSTETTSLLFVTGSWKTYLLGASNFFENTRMKNFKFFFKLIFTHLDNLINVVSCYEISQPNPLFPEDMYDYIRPIDVPKR